MAHLTEIKNWDTGIYRIETTDPVVGGEDGIANKAAKALANRTLYLKEEHEDLVQIVSDMGDSKANRSVIVPYVETIPLTNIGDIIFLKGFGEMWWTSTAYYTGYRSPRCGEVVFGTTVNPRPFEIDLVGGVYDRNTHPRFNALYQWAKENGHFIASGSWTAGPFKFADITGTSFRVPDIQNQFLRFTGTNADNANVRALGSYQGDSIRNTKTFGEVITNQFKWELGSTNGKGYLKSSEGSIVATNGTETRPVNTAFAPRIIAF